MSVHLVKLEMAMLRDQVLLMGGEVENAVDRAMHALVDRDSELAEMVLANDDEVDALELRADQTCARLLAQQPTDDRELRFVITAIKITPILERVADHACNIARAALDLNNEPQLKSLADLPRMSRYAREMLKHSLDAFAAADPLAAREVIERDEEIDRLYDRIFHNLLDQMSKDPAAAGRAARLLLVAKHLERIGDYVTDICELIVYMTEARVIKHQKDACNPDILIIEDDADIAESIRYNLERERAFTAQVALTGEAGLTAALIRPPRRDPSKRVPDLIVLDINLPGMNGFELCRRLRTEESTRRTPIIVLTARTEEGDKVRGLELGADDYITKPFSVRELVARIKAALRRSGFDAQAPASYDDERLHIDYADFAVSCSGQKVRLTRKEFALLAILSRNKGRVVPREQLLDQVWGLEYYGEARTLDVHISGLRKKLGACGSCIETMIGVGYRFLGAAEPEQGPSPVSHEKLALAD